MENSDSDFACFKNMMILLKYLWKKHRKNLPAQNRNLKSLKIPRKTQIKYQIMLSAIPANKKCFSEIVIPPPEKNPDSSSVLIFD